MNYAISNQELTEPPRFNIIGCGGTGGFLAEGLCRLLIGSSAEITLIDHDIVEPRNLLRQNFTLKDIGQFKSRTRAERLAREFNRPIAHCIYPYNESMAQAAQFQCNINIACVDNSATRNLLHQRTHYNRSWYIDAGNGETWGQILIGNTRKAERLKANRAISGSICHALPLPGLQRPDLLEPDPPETPEVDCAAAVELTDQAPTINATMAALTVQTVRKILQGTCHYLALYLDLSQGTVMPQPITREALDKWSKQAKTEEKNRLN